jgi:hypothetical protein
LETPAADGTAGETSQRVSTVRRSRRSDLVAATACPEAVLDGFEEVEGDQGLVAGVLGPVQVDINNYSTKSVPPLNPEAPD